jgi:hypothetical protein
MHTASNTVPCLSNSPDRSEDKGEDCLGLCGFFTTLLPGLVARLSALCLGRGGICGEDGGVGMDACMLWRVGWLVYGTIG